MSPRDPRLQAAALRLAAERIERGEPLAQELAEALANDMARHPEEVAAIEAHESPLPQWMADELDLREREDSDTGEDADVVMARLLPKQSARQADTPLDVIRHIERMTPEEQAQNDRLLERDRKYGLERAPDEK